MRQNRAESLGRLGGEVTALLKLLMAEHIAGDLGRSLEAGDE
jgi:hypothetical protein